MLNRRKFLQVVSLTGLGLAAGAPVMKAAASMLSKEPAPAEVGSTILRRLIPKSQEKIPVVGLGTSRTFEVGFFDPLRAQLKEILRLFFQMQGTMIDSSPQYSNAEQVVGKMVAELGHTQDMFVATKVWTEGKRKGEKQMEQSLKRFRRGMIDLIQVHNLVDWQTQLETLREWKAEGKIRYLGITHWIKENFSDLESIMKTEDLDFVQLPYSMMLPDAEERLLPLAQDRGIAVIANRPYENGHLFPLIKGKQLPEWAAEFDCTTWGQFFLKYLISHPAMTCVIPTTTKPHHLQDNMRAGYGKLPSPEQRRRMLRFVQDL